MFDKPLVLVSLRAQLYTHCYSFYVGVVGS